jgi:hypothetical protein
MSTTNDRIRGRKAQDRALESGEAFECASCGDVYPLVHLVPCGGCCSHEHCGDPVCLACGELMLERETQ